jgi:uncharacterized lipoprotein YmbA
MARSLSALLVGLVLAACNPLKPQEDPTRFYFLTLIESSEADDLVQMDAAIGVGPVSLTPYLKRTPIATRVGEHEVEYSQIDRWAEPLDIVIPFYIATNLNYLLNPADIQIYPWYGADRMDYVVKISMIGFQRNADGEAELEADWDIEGGAGNDLVSRNTLLVVPATENTTRASVAALSEALSDFSREIAAAIGELEANQPARAR